MQSKKLWPRFVKRWVMCEMQNRLKSWALWTSIAALVVFCVKEFAGVDISDTVNGLLNVLLPVLIAFGIINNPTDGGNL